MIDFSLDHSLVIPANITDPSLIRFNINGFSNHPVNGMPNYDELQFEKFPVSFAEYEGRFKRVLEEIRFGNTYLLNLTCKTRVSVNRGLKELYEDCQAKYKLWYNNEFIVFSPETFVKIQNGIISSYPMKGTIDATLPGAAEKLLSDPKEIAEHYTIVDLIRNDLSSVAKQVRVEEFRYIERLETNFGALLQVSSRISGVLPESYPENIGDIIFKLLPAGSISGAPKEKTIQIIKETEGYERGFYTGVFGYFDGINLESAVMIRFIESDNEGLIFKSGGGITSFSDPVSEYNEMIDKVYVPIA